MLKAEQKEVVAKKADRFAKARAAYKKQRDLFKKQQEELNLLKGVEKFNLRTKMRGAGHPDFRKKKKYSTPLMFKNKIIDYLAERAAADRAPTVSGMLVHLGLTRSQIDNYAQDPTYREILELTRNIMENWYEEMLVTSKANPSGIIFALKNKFGWKDVQTTENQVTNSEEELIHRIAGLAPDLVKYLISQKEQEKYLEAPKGEVVIDASSEIQYINGIPNNSLKYDFEKGGN